MENIGRRGFLKGLAGLTGGALVGQYVVDAPSVVEAKDFALPLRDIIVPKSPRIVVAQSISAPVDRMEILVERWSIEQRVDPVYYWDGAVGKPGGLLRDARISIEGYFANPGDPGNDRVLTAAFTGKRLRIYIEDIDE